MANKLFNENKKKLEEMRKNFRCYGCNGPLTGEIDSRTYLSCENEKCPIRVIRISIRS